MTLRRGLVYGRPLLQAWLHPDSNTIPNNCVKENSLWLNGYGIGVSSGHTRFEFCPIPVFLPYICLLFLCYGLSS